MKTKFEAFLGMFILLVSFCAVILATINNGGGQLANALILLNSVLVNWLVFKRVTE
jgi:hypothetical protein